MPLDTIQYRGRDCLYRDTQAVLDRVTSFATRRTWIFCRVGPKFFNRKQFVRCIRARDRKAILNMSTMYRFGLAFTREIRAELSLGYTTFEALLLSYSKKLLTNVSL